MLTRLERMETLGVKEANYIPEDFGKKKKQDGGPLTPKKQGRTEKLLPTASEKTEREAVLG